MADTASNGLDMTAPDIDMQDQPAHDPATNSSAHLPDLPVAEPARTATPPTGRPSSIPPAPVAPPEKPAAHGSPTRVYLNQNITPHLLEGMKYLAAYEPEKPLKWLSDFLAKKSAEIEGP